MSTYRHTCDTAQVPPAPLAIAPQWWVGSVLRFQKCQRAHHDPGFPEHGQALPNFHPSPTPLPLNTGGRAVQCGMWIVHGAHVCVCCLQQAGCA